MICELFKAPVIRLKSPKIINYPAISLLGKFSIIAFSLGAIWLLINLEQLKLTISKTGSKVLSFGRYSPAISRFGAAKSGRRHIFVLPLT